MAVVVVSYSPEWPRQFDRLAAQVRECLNGLPAAVEHVGSTAVPGLAAKPVLDVDVIVDGRLLGAAVNAWSWRATATVATSAHWTTRLSWLPAIAPLPF